MKKVYFVVALNGPKEKQAVGVFGQDYLGGQPATKEQERELLQNAISPTPSLYDAWLDGTYNNMRVFTREEARRAARRLNSGEFGVSYFLWSVAEIGESKRSVKEKPLGWRIMLGSVPSSLNNEGSIKVEQSNLFNGDMDADTLFATRSQARRAINDGSSVTRSTPRLRIWREVPVYASDLCFTIYYNNAPTTAQSALNDVEGDVRSQVPDKFSAAGSKSFSTRELAEQALDKRVEKRHQKYYTIRTERRAK